MEKVEKQAVWTVKKANEWMAAASEMPAPRALFDEFWLEGELAIMFADTGMGKSALAVQIADSIARGRACEPMKMDAPAQQVLYFDLDLAQKQFEMRYSAEGGGHHRFSERLSRVEIDRTAPVPEGFASLEECLAGAIGHLVSETGARVVVIDSITSLKRTYESTRELLPMMRELKRLQKAYGLSILVLAQTPRRAVHRPLVMSDLQGAKVLANFADSIFAIGADRRAARVRYIKHIRARTGEMWCAAAHVPFFRLQKSARHFLGFEFLHYAPESGDMRDARDARAWRLIDRIRDLADGGWTVREIAAELAMSKSAVHRYIRMSELNRKDAGTGKSVRTVEADGSLCGERVIEDLAPVERYAGEHTDRSMLQMGFASEARAARLAASRADAGVDASPPVDAADVPVTADEPEPAGPPDQGNFAFLNLNLKPRLDAYDKMIYVQDEMANGKPLVWFETDRHGHNFRFERKGIVVIREKMAC
jgi:AraC-like DNA-binding protein